MRQTTGTRKSPGEKIVKDIKWAIPFVEIDGFAGEVDFEVGCDSMLLLGVAGAEVGEAESGQPRGRTRQRAILTLNPSHNLLDAF